MTNKNNSHDMRRAAEAGRRQTAILYKELSHRIIGIAFKVHTKIGSALPEHCYHHALQLEFDKQGIPHTSQERQLVHYNEEMVGHFFTDIIVDSKIILELKSDDKISQGHIAQLFTYLRVTGIRVGYLLNFGYKSLQFKRLIL